MIHLNERLQVTCMDYRGQSVNQWLTLQLPHQDILFCFVFILWEGFTFNFCFGGRLQGQTDVSKIWVDNVKSTPKSLFLFKKIWMNSSSLFILHRCIHLQMFEIWIHLNKFSNWSVTKARESYCGFGKVNWNRTIYAIVTKCLVTRKGQDQGYHGASLF